MHFLARCLLCCCLLSAHAALAGDTASTLDFWQQDLASRVPLNVEEIGRTESDGVSIQQLRYSGALRGEQPDRVFALYAAPEGPGPFPAVLQIHGGGQSCYPSNVAYFVKRGYACLSFDWTGPRRGERPAESTTDWGERTNDNHYGDIGQDLREVVLYPATIAAVRGIDFLCSRPEADDERIGIQGISWGGLLAWLVNGLDDRVKASMPVYGIGDVDEHANTMGVALRNRSPEYRAIWRSHFDPASYAAYQHGAVMFLNGANDFWGPLLIAERRLKELRVPCRRSYGPNRMHSLAPASVEAGMAWFDAHLKGGTTFPEEPSLLLNTSGDGQLRAIITADTTNKIEAVRIDYSRGPEPPITRCWLSNPAMNKGDGTWQANIPLVSPTDRLMAMAQVTYEGGYTITSAIVDLIPGEHYDGIIATQKASDTISDPAEDVSGWYIARGTDFTHAASPDATLRYAVVEGRDAILAALAVPTDSLHLATRLMVDPARNRGGNRKLECWIHDLADVTVHKDKLVRKLEPTNDYNKEYQMTVGGGAGWHRIVLTPSDFSDSLTTWDPTYRISLEGRPITGGKPAVGVMRWIE